MRDRGKEKELLQTFSITEKNEEFLSANYRQRSIDHSGPLEDKNLDWDYILAEAEHHGLTSLLYYNLQRKNLINYLPAQIDSKLEKKYYAAAFSNLKMSEEFKFLLSAFRQESTQIKI